MQDRDTTRQRIASLAREDNGGHSRLQRRRTRLYEESIEQDSADCNDCCYSFESLVFSSLLWMQPCTEPHAPKESYAASKAFKLHAYHRALWAQLLSSTTCSEGVCVWKCELLRWTPLHAGVPRRARCQRRRGSGRTPRRRQVELPRLPRLKGCFDISDVWS